MNRTLALICIATLLASTASYAGGNDGHIALDDGSKIWISGSHKKPGKRAWYRTQKSNGKLTSCKRYKGSENTLRKSMLKKKGGTWRKGAWPTSVHC